MTLPKDAGRPRDPCFSPAWACLRSQELSASLNVTTGSQWLPRTSADHSRGPQGFSQVLGTWSLEFLCSSQQLLLPGPPGVCEGRAPGSIRVQPVTAVVAITATMMAVFTEDLIPARYSAGH